MVIYNLNFPQFVILISNNFKNTKPRSMTDAKTTWHSSLLKAKTPKQAVLSCGVIHHKVIGGGIGVTKRYYCQPLDVLTESESCDTKHEFKLPSTF